MGRGRVQRGALAFSNSSRVTHGHLLSFHQLVCTRTAALLCGHTTTALLCGHFRHFLSRHFLSRHCKLVFLWGKKDRRRKISKTSFFSLPWMKRKPWDILFRDFGGDGEPSVDLDDSFEKDFSRRTRFDNKIQCPFDIFSDLYRYVSFLLTWYKYAVQNNTHTHIHVICANYSKTSEGTD